VVPIRLLPWADLQSLRGFVACTHTEVRTAGPLVIDLGPKLLLPLPPYRRLGETIVGRVLMYDESSPRLRQIL
jgi:hypothetical protein